LGQELGVEVAPEYCPPSIDQASPDSGLDARKVDKVPEGPIVALTPAREVSRTALLTSVPDIAVLSEIPVSRTYTLPGVATL